MQSNELAASISQTAGQLTLTNAQGQQTTGQWLNNTSFTAWGQTAQVIQDGNVTEILWNGNGSEPVRVDERRTLRSVVRAVQRRSHQHQSERQPAYADQRERHANDGAMAKPHQLHGVGANGPGRSERKHHANSVERQCLEPVHVDETEDSPVNGSCSPTDRTPSSARAAAS